MQLTVTVINTQHCTITLPSAPGQVGVLRPGSNEVDSDYWAQMASHPTVKMYLKVGHLQGPEPVPETPETPLPDSED